MGCGGEWSWSRNGVRKVEYVRVRGNCPRVFAGSDWGAIVLWRKCSAPGKAFCSSTPHIGTGNPAECRGDVMGYRGISWKKSAMANVGR